MNFKYALWAILLISTFSCKMYRRHVLFKADDEAEMTFKETADKITTPPNYLIQKNDQLEFLVFTNKGEVLVDPTSEFAKQITTGVGGQTTQTVKYLVQHDGMVNLPILGKIKVDSLTLHQCDSLLAGLYSKYYQDPFVKCKISNRRIFVLGNGMGSVGGGGAVGGGGGMGGFGVKVIDIENENITLYEVLAKIGGPAIYSYADRIKILRGNPSNPTIFTIDLTHYNTFTGKPMVLQPNDIVYIEPARRMSFDFIRDFGIVSTLISTLLTIYLISRL